MSKLVSKLNVAVCEAARYIDVFVEIEEECKATSAVTRVQFASQDWLLFFRSLWDFRIRE